MLGKLTIVTGSGKAIIAMGFGSSRRPMRKAQDLAEGKR
jgi:hypothetical protein